MGNRLRWQMVALTAVVVAAACSEREASDQGAPPASETKPEETGGDEPLADPCAWLASTRFRSTRAFPGGLGPDGPVTDHQQLEFVGDKYSWRREDFTESGTYRCTDGVVSAVAQGRSIEVRVDAVRRVLVWDGIEFEPFE